MHSEGDLSKRLLPMTTLPEGYCDLALKAERDVLGLMMLMGGEELISPSWFSSIEHLNIYLAIAETADIHGTTDLVTVCEYMDTTGVLNFVGGIQCIAQLVREAPRIKTWELAHVLRGFALMRYAMAKTDGAKVIVRLTDAVANGWLHGKAWRVSSEQILACGPDFLAGSCPVEREWVCYAYVDGGELS